MLSGPLRRYCSNPQQDPTSLGYDDDDDDDDDFYARYGHPCGHEQLLQSAMDVCLGNFDIALRTAPRKDQQ